VETPDVAVKITYKLMLEKKVIFLCGQAGYNASTIALRVAEGDEKVSQCLGA
jgi:hypothetical protein